MALIKCPECGKEISNKAKNCPNCGYSNKKSGNVYKVAIITIVVIVIIAMAVFLALKNRLNDSEKKQVNQVITTIVDIGNVTSDSEPEISKAEKMYNKLSKKCKWHVDNYKTLKEARKSYNKIRAKEAIKSISNIGTVSLEDRDTIVEARNIYDSLTKEQRKLVENSDDLLVAEKKLIKLEVKDAETKIAAIGNVTLKSESKITSAESAYDFLEEKDRDKVSNYNVLVSARKKYDQLVVNNCILLIDNIGEISLKSGNKIDKIENIYDSLSDSQKNMVTNYSKLQKARENYDALIKKEEIKKKTLKPGMTFKTSKWNITYRKSSISAKILPNDISDYYLYYSAADDQTFVDLIFKIQNIDSDILDLEGIIGDCTVEYDDANLSKNYDLYYSSGSDIDQVYSWDGLDALDSTTLHVAISMPRELQTNKKSITVKLEIAGEEKIINVR